MISKEVFDFAMNIGTQPVNNRYLWHAENSIPVLTLVNDGTVPFFSDAYSILANTLERIYKGVLIELAKIRPSITFPDDFDSNHHFNDTARIVNQYIPIASNREAYYTTLENLNRIQRGYTGAKFKDVYELEDFQKDFRRLELQRKRLYAGLEQLIIQDRCKDVMHIDDIPHEDLDLE